MTQTTIADSSTSLSFFEALREQRWDDHRYYHQSRINQSLHLFSALCFLTAYVMIFINPIAAVILGWFVAMVPRQAGHFFFEPHDYDKINRATHEHKEDIKIGYNLKRKVVLLSVFALMPIVMWFDQTFFGLFVEPLTGGEFFHNLCVVWLGLAGAAIVFRTVHLFFLYNVQTGLVWATKIFTDPFHDIKLYWKAPAQVLRGDLWDPMDDHWGPAAGGTNA